MLRSRLAFTRSAITAARTTFSRGIDLQRRLEQHLARIPVNYVESPFYQPYFPKWQLDISPFSFSPLSYHTHCRRIDEIYAKTETHRHRQPSSTVSTRYRRHCVWHSSLDWLVLAIRTLLMLGVDAEPQSRTLPADIRSKAKDSREQ